MSVQDFIVQITPPEYVSCVTQAYRTSASVVHG